MALNFEDKNICSICCDPIGNVDEIISFPAFITNEKSKYFRYSDNVVHLSCLFKDPEHKKILTLRDKYLSATAPKNRKCYIDGTVITEPEDHLFLDYVTDDEKSFLAELVYSNFKLSNLKKWDELNRFKAALYITKDKGGAERYISWLLDQLY